MRHRVSPAPARPLLLAFLPAAMLMAGTGNAQDIREPWATGAPAAPANVVPSRTDGGSQPGLGPPPGPSVPPQAIAAANLQPAGLVPGNTNRGDAGSNLPLGLTQKAWEAPNSHMGPGQTRPGLKPIRWSPGLTPEIVLREGMISTIEFPPEEQIVGRLISDPQSFEAIVASDRRSVAVRPIFPGVDANIVVYGQSGNVYSFYLRSSPWNNDTITDVNVPLSIPGMTNASGTSPQLASATAHLSTGSGGTPDSVSGGNAITATNAKIDGTTYDDDPAARLTLRPRANATRTGVDYAATALTGNGRLRTDLQILVPSADDAVIAPLAAWRDDRFTYLDFGPRSGSMNQWPVAALVVDRVESPVGTRVSGPNRSVMVVEAIGNIVLRNGSHIVCIRLTLAGSDTRAPIVDEPYSDRRGPLSNGTNIGARTPPPLGVTGPGTGDYQGDIRNRAGASDAPTVPSGRTSDLSAAPTRTPAGEALAYHLRTGPYDKPTAVQLAEEIGRGYRGNPPAGAIAAIVPPSQIVPQSDSTGIIGPIAQIQITAASPMLARRLCDTLRQFNHECTLY